MSFVEVIVTGMPAVRTFAFDNGIHHFELSNPAQVQSLCVSLLEPLPEGAGLSIYYSPPPYAALEFLGAIANTYPSTIISTGFGINPEVNVMASVKIALKLEPLARVAELFELTTKKDLQKEYAIKVAHNLYNFMMSYQNQVAGVGPDYVVLPKDFLERWMNKFHQKYAVDKNFIQRTTDS
jgi:hypothetical protein